jgi:hypothetical protein
VIAIGTAAAAVVAAGVAYAVSQNSSGSAHAASAGLAGAVASGPIHVDSITPASHSTGVDGAAPITVTFSALMSSKSPDPTLKPAVAGTWTADGHSLVFMPSAAIGPQTKVTVSVPSGSNGVRSAGGGLLTAAVTERFTTGKYSQLALAEALAEQGYLPLTFSPNASSTESAEGVDPASDTPAGIAYNPPAGTFYWEHGYPSTLHDMWSPGHANSLLAGAVYAFQSEHGMTINGELTSQFWTKLFKAAAAGERNKNGYSYAIASKHLPESLTIWHDGHEVFHSLANTGIPVSPTVDGTFPVYQKYTFQIMRGTNPDGSTYADPVSFVSYFNGGDAVHYFPRGSYGWQQSLGCVELPYTAAQHAYPYLTYGTLVTVSG